MNIVCGEERKNLLEDEGREGKRERKNMGELDVLKCFQFYRRQREK